MVCSDRDSGCDTEGQRRVATVSFSTATAGLVLLIPTLVVFVLAILTHRPIESLIAGSIVGLIMLHGLQFVSGFADTSVRVMMDYDVA